MEIDGYNVWYRWGATSEELKEQEWTREACFSSLKYNNHKVYPQFFQARFRNDYDKWEYQGEHSTKEWLKEFDLSPLAMSGIVDIKVAKDYYYVTLDMSILSYEWAFSILTLLRYPGEYYNICWNYWKIREVYKSLDKWEALYLAHQGSWKVEYFKLFAHGFYYNGGHSLFEQGQKMSNVKIERAFKQLDKYAPFLSKDKTLNTIQDIWGGKGYASFLNFNIPNCFVGTHVDKEIT